jgi:hypothetical protein
VKGLQAYDGLLPWHSRNSRKQAYSFWTRCAQKMFERARTHTERDGPTLNCSNFNFRGVGPSTSIVAIV